MGTLLPSARGRCAASAGAFGRRTGMRSCAGSKVKVCPRGRLRRSSGRRGAPTVAYRAEPAAEDVGLDQIHRDDLLRFHSHRSFNGRVPPRAVADVAVPQPAGGGGLWRMEK